MSAVAASGERRRLGPGGVLRTDPLDDVGRDCRSSETVWEDRLKQLSSTAMHRWWAKRLQVAGIAHRPMHEARHTAITAFLRATGNLKLAQMLAGHADNGTTANIYTHLDTTDLETALKAINEAT